ncbi:hypothetical protein RN001_010283 [Aquatica leii]|uniref:Peptidase S1 domain-containing protein n=1 Tax=Aquatica leii TaxID=1421715 RepID=A0AAN7PW85_9COLE|nr:hypothetical protein RN001_010283 [Aquatica leii]
MFVLLLLIHQVVGHGMMLDPVNRSSRWRYNATAPPNYSDMGLFCGGYSAQWVQNDGKCGVCGDNYQDRVPRDNENTGTYGQGVIVAQYPAESIINVTVLLTQNHHGTFSFSLCHLVNTTLSEDEDCFQSLFFTDGTDKMLVKPGNGNFTYQIQLPLEFKCAHCVFRWNYRTGNSWGIDDDDSLAMIFNMIWSFLLVKAAVGIIGGYDAEIKQHPYQVAIVNKRHNLVCGGGSLIALNVVLTAAHCLNHISNDVTRILQIRAGSEYVNKQGELRGIKAMYPHPKYEDFYMEYDVSVLLLDKPFVCHRELKPIKLIQINETISETSYANVTGWGFSKPGKPVAAARMQCAAVPQVTSEFCGRLYDFITDRMICFGFFKGDTAVCSGDAGNPLVINNIQVGVASWVDNCDALFTPAVYVNLADGEVRKHIDCCISASRNALPSIAIVNKRHNLVCGEGSLIALNVVLTVAHCLNHISNDVRRILQIRAGSEYFNSKVNLEGDAKNLLVINNIQVGVSSWVDNCDALFTPGIYVNLADGEVRKHIDCCISPSRNDSLAMIFNMIWSFLLEKAAVGIIGGYDAEIKQHPYQVAIVNKRNYLVCGGGSLIALNVVLTAAHCLNHISNDVKRILQIRAGSEYVNKHGELRGIKAMYPHPKYEDFYMEYDVSVLILDKPFVSSRELKPIKLIQINQTISENSYANVTGWGFSKPGETVAAARLQCAAVPKVTSEFCERFYDLITDRMICFGFFKGKKAICSGDAGNPLVINNIQVGVASWVDHCDALFIPAIYVNLANGEVRKHIDCCISASRNGKNNSQCTV